MAVYVYPLNPTAPVTIGAGADFATETTLLLIESAVDGLEALVTSTNSKLDTVITHVDTLETLITDLKTQIKPEYASAWEPSIRDFSSVGLSTNSWSQYIASTSARATVIQYANESGYPVELGFGANLSEISQLVLAESGEVKIVIPSGTRLSLRCASAVSAGNFWISAFN